MNKELLSKALIIISLGAFLSACNSQTEESKPVDQAKVSKLESAMADLQSKYDELRQRKPSEALDWATDDLKNIGDWEYKVIEFSGLAAQDLEKELNELGKDRWQVFWVKESSSINMQVMLKRPTVSYLSKLPLSSLGKMMLNGEGQ